MAKGNRKVVRRRGPDVAHGGAVPRKILVATDFSPVGNKAFTFASQLARKFGATLALIHVVPPVFQVEGLDAAGIAREGEDWARKQVEQLRQQPEEIVIAHGDPVDTIVREAKRQKADLLVLGSRGMSGLRGFMLGSVAQRVLQQAHCPVLVVPKLARVPK